MNPGFKDLLISLLVTEKGHRKEHAEKAVIANPDLVIKGIMTGNQSLRGIAILLDEWIIKNITLPK